MRSIINQVPLSIRRFGKLTILILPMALAVFLFISQARLPGAFAADARQPDYAVTSGKVIVVYEAKEGDAVFKAYGVSWKNHQVVVIDPLANTNYKDGDVIQFIAVTIPNPIIGAKTDTLSFLAVPAPPKSRRLKP